jgi:type VI secretion system secreted protein Hcp
LAVSDYFLKIDGISGESKDSKHKDEIELVSFSWGLTEAAPPRGGWG